MSRFREMILRNKVVFIVAAVAILSLAAGFVARGFIQSPADAAAEAKAPDAGLITEKVEKRQINNTVSTRGDVNFANPVEVKPTVPTGSSRAVITGAVPTVGQTVEAGQVLLEVSNRPVIALPGDLPAFRSLSYGLKGRDVVQLRHALANLGYNVGDADYDVYDSSVANAVAALFRDRGYEAPKAEKGSGGGQGADPVDEAQKVFEEAQNTYNKAVASLNAARNQPPEQGSGGQDAASLQVDVTAALRTMNRARDALQDARNEALTPLPVNQVVYLTELPRRVDEVKVKLGQEPKENEAAVTVSGAQLSIKASVSKEEADLLKVGGPATMQTSHGELHGTIASVQPEASDSGDSSQDGGGSGGKKSGTTGQYTVLVSPSELNDEQKSSLRAEGNVKLDMTVASSSKDSLVVPVAAISADSAGNARIEVVDGQLVKGKPSKEQKTRTITVEVGLAAEGYVELTKVKGKLKPGELVVVGTDDSGSKGDES